MIDGVLSVDAPYFNAGAVIEAGTVSRQAPILEGHLKTGMTYIDCIAYCMRKGWKVSEIKSGSVPSVLDLFESSSPTVSSSKPSPCPKGESTEPPTAPSPPSPRSSAKSRMTTRPGGKSGSPKSGKKKPT